VGGVLLVLLTTLWDHLLLRYMAGVAVGIFAFFESASHKKIYKRAPTPAQFFSDSPHWKLVALVCGFILAAIAIAMLTIAQDFARDLGKDRSHLLMFFGVLSVPFLAFTAHHQWAVFRALGNDEA
jgi:hypothetical protein